MNEMKKERKKLGNKGFSLIELIIAMAIMAILVGALAPQYLRYVERARRSNDIQAAATIGRATQIALTDQKLIGASDPSFHYSKVGAITASDIEKKVYEIVGTEYNLESTGYVDFYVAIGMNSDVVDVKVFAITTASGTDTSAGSVQIFPTVDANFKDGKKAD
jgi:type IV pilus assembly protein PilA